MAFGRYRHPAGIGLCIAALTSSCWNPLSELPQMGSQANASTQVPTHQELLLESVEWGRLVHIFDQEGQLVASDVVIRDSLQSDEVDYRLETDWLTQQQQLRILHPADHPDFRRALAHAVAGRQTVLLKGPLDQEAHTQIPRNAAIRLQFSLPLQPESVDELSIQIRDPRSGRPLAARRLVRNAEQESAEKRMGVVVLDPVGRADEPHSAMAYNPAGFPSSSQSLESNLEIRIPIRPDPALGYTRVLTDSTGTKQIQTRPQDLVDYTANGDPVLVRSARSGNSQDSHAGFLRDNDPPELLTQQEVQIFGVQAQGQERTLIYRIQSSGCRGISPKVGDLFEVGTGVLLVDQVIRSDRPTSYVVAGSLLQGNIPPGNYSGAPLTGTLTSKYSEEDAPLQLCWVKFDPEPVGGLPARGVRPFSSMTVYFSEAIAPDSVSAMRSMVLSSFQVDQNPLNPERQFDGRLESTGDYIDRLLGFNNDVSGQQTGSGRIKFGPIEPDIQFQRFTLTPLAGIADSHNEGQVMKVALALRNGLGGITDLSGNPLAIQGFVAGNVGQQETMSPASLQNWPKDRYFALRFSGLDEDGDGLSEYAGQMNFQSGTLKGRPLTRFSRLADSSNRYIGQRIALSQGLATPLQPAGSVLMSVWGYHHFGLGLLAPQTLNLDVEGMSWAPFGGQVFHDSFPEVSMALSHSNRFPDDSLSPVSGFPLYPNSGLRRQEEFDRNVLGYPSLTEEVVFDSAYDVDQADVFTAASGTPMLPWPEFSSTYTWRDTGISQELVGGSFGQGVPPGVTGQSAVYPEGEVPSVGSPLLARVRVEPRGTTFGVNGFQAQLMVGSSALPAFRVFSSGGRDAGGSWHLVHPDVPPCGVSPCGGYNSSTGQITRGDGPELYWSQVDFAVKVSRVYTHWFQLGGDLISAQGPILEVGEGGLPGEADIVVEFRGADDLQVAGCSAGVSILTDALTQFDVYGDANGCGSSSLNGVTDWTTDLQDLAGGNASFVQIRVSFFTDTALQFEPKLHSLGFTWATQ